MLDPTRRTSRAVARAKRRPLLRALTVCAALSWGCGGGGDAADSAAEPETQGGQAEVARPTAASPDAPSGPIDQALASQGTELFTSRGCVACHTPTSDRLVGPGLAGVTDRRSFDWIYAIITNPDSMLANDATAKSLLAEYYTPMPNQQVQPDEAMALYEYMRSLGGGETAAP